MLLRTEACQSRACRAFCSLWPWKVWPFGPARSVLCSRGRFAASPLHALFSGARQRPLSYMSYRVAIRRTGDAGDTGAPLQGDGEDVVQGTPLERLSGNLRVPLWSFVSFVIPRNTSALSNALFVARLPRPSRSNQASKPLNFQASRGAIAPTLLYSTFWRPKRGIWRSA